MSELRARFKPEVVALSEYLGRDMVSEWGYDSCRVRQRPRRAARARGSRTSSSSATPRAARPRFTRCSGAIRRSSCPRTRSRGSSRPTCARAFSPAARARHPRRSSSTCRCSPAPRPSSARARPPPPTSGRRPRRGDRRGGSPRRASSRSCASRPTSCVRCICSCCRRTSRAVRDLRKAIELESDRSRRDGTSPDARTGHSCCSTPSTSATSSSCAAIDECSAPSRMLVLIYEDFRANNDATVRDVFRFLEVDDRAPIDVLDANPTVRCAPSSSTTSSTRCRSGPGRRARREGGAQGARAAAAQTQRPALRPATRRPRAPAAGRRAAYARAAPALQRGGEALSEYLGATW